MQANGKIPRCEMSDCFAPLEFVVEDSEERAGLGKRKFCERHYRELVINPLEKARQAAVLRAETLARSIQICNGRITLAKKDYHVVDILPYLHCKHGCGFKIQYSAAGLVPRDAVIQHETLNCPNLAKNKKKETKPRAPSIKRAPVGLTEDDLT